MYNKGKNAAVPSDAQAREKLALYVYEYLLHIGAQKAAQTFLNEIRWEKNITLGEPPGFLHSWWCVFWDLYCAAPERRDSCEHSSEAKAFHDYGFVNSGYGLNGLPNNAGPAPSPLGQIPPNDGMSSGPLSGGFFPNSSMRPSPPQQSQVPSQILANQPFMGPRFQGGPRPGIRMSPLGNDFNSATGQPLMPGMDPLRQGASSMGPINPRMNPPRSMGPLGSYGGPGMRGPPPNATLGSSNMPPISMSGGPIGRPSHWQSNLNTPMGYSSSSSPGAYGGPSGSGGPPGPGTPIMQSPQDSSNSGGENMYTMMKPVTSMSNDFQMNNVPDSGSLGPMAPNSMSSVLNGDGLDGMKNSPGPPGTPREDSGNGMGDYNLAGFGGTGENVIGLDLY
ncbi:single-stranded DNA-binding protein 3 isoform X2 [Daktulosphaira vitifoliae]|uniref:single-stranded DNA-binding protein 3 isoform X2 n=1 Tax=Daktulosphaira vitifoliae TaxID=58002 RepID=UPI0021AAB03F|nr:single-stranded DNA-binding protein 3 isoform X2 [Daktulosphaira vitifoliae]